MKNPGFLINGMIVVLKPHENDSFNTIAVVIGRFSKITDGEIEYVALPVVLNKDEDYISIITKNETMASYISFHKSDILYTIGIIRNTEEKEWVITNTINYLRDKDDSIEDKTNKVIKLELSLESAVAENDYIKFKWIIFNDKKLDKYAVTKWIDELTNNKDFYLNWFNNIKEKDIDLCIYKLSKNLEKIKDN